MATEEFDIVAKVRLVAENVNEFKDNIKKKTEEVTSQIATPAKTAAKTITSPIEKVTGFLTRILPTRMVKGAEDFTERFTGLLSGLGIPIPGAGKEAEGGGLIGGGKGAGAGVRGGAGGGFAAVLFVAFLIFEVVGKVFDVLKKIYNFLKDASPHLKATHNILSKALQIFFMPFGNIIGILLRPLALILLRFAVAFYRLMLPFEKFLIQFTKDPFGAIANLMKDIGNLLSDLFNKLISALPEETRKIIDGIANSISAAISISSLTDAINQLPSKIADAIRTAPTALASVPPVGQSIVPASPQKDFWHNLFGW